MPGSVRVSVLEVVDLPLSLVGRTVQVRVALGKKEYKTKPVRAHGGRTPPWNADFAFPVLNLRDQLFIVIVGSRGETMTKAEIEVASVVQNGFRDDFVALQGGGRIHLKLSFVLSEEERRRIEAMRVANQRKREQDALKARQNSAELNGNGPWKADASAVTITEVSGDADQDDKENEGRAGFVKPGKQLKVAKPVSGGEDRETAAGVPGGVTLPVQQDAGGEGPAELANSAGEVINDERLGVPVQEEQIGMVELRNDGPQDKGDGKANESPLQLVDSAENAVLQTASCEQLDGVSSGHAVYAEPLQVLGTDISKDAATIQEDFRLEQGRELENMLEQELGEKWMDEWMPEGASETKSREVEQVLEQPVDLQIEDHELKDDNRTQVDDCEEELGQLGGATKDVGVTEESILQEGVQELSAAAPGGAFEKIVLGLPQSDSISHIVDKSLPFREQLKAIQQRWEQDDHETHPQDSPTRKEESGEKDHTSEGFEERLKAIQDRWKDASRSQETDNRAASDDDEEDDDYTNAREFLRSWVEPDDKDQPEEEILNHLNVGHERWDKPSGFSEDEAGRVDDEDDNYSADVQKLASSFDNSAGRDEPSEGLLEQFRAIHKRWDVEEALEFQGGEDDLAAGKDEDGNERDGRDVQELPSNSGRHEAWDQSSDGLGEKLDAVQESPEKDKNEYQGEGRTASAHEGSVAPTSETDQREEETTFSNGSKDTFLLEMTLSAESEPAFSTCPQEEGIQFPSLATSLTKPPTTAGGVHHVCSEGNDAKRTPRLGSIIAHFVGGAAIVAGAAAVAWSVGSRKYHTVSERDTFATLSSSHSSHQNSRFCKLNPGVCESSRVYPGQRLRLA